MMQDSGYKIQDTRHASCIMHRVSWLMAHASCIVIFILVCLAGCKGKETPKPVGIAPPPQEVKTATPEQEKK